MENVDSPGTFEAEHAIDASRKRILSALVL